jgi:hypothetical protein
MFAAAIPGIVSTIVGGIAGYFKDNNATNISLEQIRLATQQATQNALAAHEQTLMTIAKGQSDQNLALAKTGELGWRAWLAQGLTICFLALIGTIVLGTLGIVLGSFFSLNITPIAAAVASVPVTLLEFLWGALTFLLGGLYVARGTEKLNVIKASNQFNEKMFFDEIRRLRGALSQDEVDQLKSAINKASSNLS